MTLNFTESIFMLVEYPALNKVRNVVGVAVWRQVNICGKDTGLVGLMTMLPALRAMNHTVQDCLEENE